MKNYKSYFPIFNQLINGQPLVYLDSSATSQKPQTMMDALQNFYMHNNANVHRGVHELSERATRAYEETRKRLRKFINAQHDHEIIFVSGTTEGINLISQSYGGVHFKEGDEVILSEMEHHANIVPWQMLRDQKKIHLRIIPVSEQGELDLNVFKKFFSNRTKLVSVTHASNVLGTVNPIKEITRIAHEHGVPVLVDGAQAFPHLPVNVKELDCDFYVFSAHKAYGPTGLGVLYGKTSLLEKMQPYQGGGYMIEKVSFEKTTYNVLPYKLEAGTPPIASVVAFGAALDFLNEIGMEQIREHEEELLHYALARLQSIPGLKIFGKPKHRIGVISFILQDIHAHDIGTVLNHRGIAVRAGHHCAMPLMDRFNVPAMVRASLGLYNNSDDIDALIEGLLEAKRLFK